MSTVNRLRCLEKLGEGTYGVVFKAKELSTGQIVAFKRMMITGEDVGISATALREVCLLKELKHDNIVSLYDVLFEPPKMTLIFEYCEYDLKKYMEKNSNKSKVGRKLEVQQIMKQILEGLQYMHSRSVVHRDLKPENIFINIYHGEYEGIHSSAAAAKTEVIEAAPAEHNVTNKTTLHSEMMAGNSSSVNTPLEEDTDKNNKKNTDDDDDDDGSDAMQLVVKLGDFGLARVENIPVKRYSHDVVSLWYRSPDVILGSTLYGFTVDMWSVGCIFAEMITGKPLLSGRTDVEQLVKIFQLLGTPTPKIWPSMFNYPKSIQVIEAASKYVRGQTTEMMTCSKDKSTRLSNHTHMKYQSKDYTHETTRQGSEHVVLECSTQSLEGEKSYTNNSVTSTHSETYNFPSELCFQSTLDEYLETSLFRERAGDDGVDLLRGLLSYEPSYRLTAHNALNHPFLKNVRIPIQGQIDTMAMILKRTLKEHGLLELCNLQQ